MLSTRKIDWIPASTPSAEDDWVEAKLPNGRHAVAKWTADGWLPLYPAGHPVAWRPINGRRFRVFPRKTSA
jgi:hypothetical protein